MLQPLNGPGSDEPLVWYEGTGTSDRRFLVADERGSIVAVTDSAGAALAINRYDEYGGLRPLGITVTVHLFFARPRPPSALCWSRIASAACLEFGEEWQW